MDKFFASVEIDGATMVWQCGSAEKAASSVLRSARKHDAKYGGVYVGPCANDVTEVASLRVHPITGPYLCVDINHCTLL